MATKELSFRGQDIKNAFDLVLAFQVTLEGEDNFKQLAWHISKIQKGDSGSVNVTYEPLFAVSTATIEKDFITNLGHLKQVKLGQRVELKGSGDDLEWQNFTNLDTEHQSDIWFDNKTDKKQDINIHLVDSKRKFPAPILLTSSAKNTLSKATFKPTLSAYVAHNYPHDQVHLTNHVKSSIESFREVDLTTLDDVTYYVITEDENTGEYTITADPKPE